MNEIILESGLAVAGLLLIEFGTRYARALLLVSLLAVVSGFVGDLNEVAYVAGFLSLVIVALLLNAPKDLEREETTKPVRMARVSRYF